MHSLKSYLERRTDAELQHLLLSYCEGHGDIDAETALLICEVLSGRKPGNQNPRMEFIRLCLRYTV